MSNHRWGAILIQDHSEDSSQIYRGRRADQRRARGFEGHMVAMSLPWCLFYILDWIHISDSSCTKDPSQVGSGPEFSEYAKNHQRYGLEYNTTEAAVLVFVPDVCWRSRTKTAKLGSNAAINSQTLTSCDVLSL